ncbi:hypothetical protein BDZ89DRAFT_1147221 [Hymenopellis radicata]|nr:hypothetical protein BDZ89DRAFT_1147221 [Hymenopellis radicata]
MGRKAKYATEEQRREARAQYDADYYSKNRRKILKKRKKAYAEKLEASASGEGTSIGRDTTSTTREISSSFKIIRRQQKRLDRLIGRSLREYASGLCDEVLLRPTMAMSILEAALNAVNDTADPAKVACNRIWELTGASSDHVKAVDMIDHFRQALDVVGNVFNEATNDLDNFTSLRQGMERQTLAYFQL